jgi:hypothetical protein
MDPQAPPPSSSSRTVIIAFAAVILACAGIVGYAIWKSRHASPSLQATLAAGYATQPLTDPFVLDSKAWDSQTNTWRYVYHSKLGVPQAAVEAKLQLAKGAYQVNAHRPDTKNAQDQSTILYRDLITEDIAVTVQVLPNVQASTDHAAPPTTVTVEFRKMTGSN